LTRSGCRGDGKKGHHKKWFMEEAKSSGLNISGSGRGEKGGKSLSNTRMNLNNKPAYPGWCWGGVFCKKSSEEKKGKG